MELSQRSLEASCKLAFELGQAKAQEDWDRFHEKEASLFSGVAGGVRSFLRGTGFAQGGERGLHKGFTAQGDKLKGAVQAAEQRVKDLGSATGAQMDAAKAQLAQAEQAFTRQQGLYGAAGTAPTTLRQTFTAPFKDAYQGFRANRFNARGAALKAEQDAAVKAQKALPTTATPAQQQAAAKRVQEAGDRVTRHNSNLGAQRYGFADPAAAVARAERGYGYVPTALGYAAIPAGAAYLGYQALPGGNTYNVTSVQPQVAPHQYYLNQMSRMFS